MLCIFMENVKMLFFVKFVFNLMVRMEKFNLDYIFFINIKIDIFVLVKNLIEFIVDNICLVQLLGLSISKCYFKRNLIFDVKLYFFFNYNFNNLDFNISLSID